MLHTTENQAKFKHCPQVNMNGNFREYKNIVYSAHVSPDEKDLHPGWKVIMNAYKKARKLFKEGEQFPNSPYIVYDNREEIALQGNVVALVGADDFYGSDRSKPYQSKVMANPTWDDLAKCADESIDFTGDHHHQFFESFSIKNEMNGITYVGLHFGS